MGEQFGGQAGLNELFARMETDGFDAVPQVAPEFGNRGRARETSGHTHDGDVEFAITLRLVCFEGHRHSIAAACRARASLDFLPRAFSARACSAAVCSTGAVSESRCARAAMVG